MWCIPVLFYVTMRIYLLACFELVFIKMTLICYQLGHWHTRLAMTPLCFKFDGSANVCAEWHHVENVDEYDVPPCVEASSFSGG